MHELLLSGVISGLGILTILAFWVAVNERLRSRRYRNDITRITLRLLSRYDLMTRSEADKDLKDMMVALIANIDTMPLDKQSRWLGYL